MVSDGAYDYQMVVHCGIDCGTRTVTESGDDHHIPLLLLLQYVADWHLMLNVSDFYRDPICSNEIDHQKLAERVHGEEDDPVLPEDRVVFGNDADDVQLRSY